jgi:BCD family chlorophyll transporter-like MFS transporter
MISLPVLFAPMRALIGFKSDNHRSALGWKRVPFIWKGTMYQFGGLAIMPFALLVLSGGGESGNAAAVDWPGRCRAGFLMVGAGLHTVQTAGLALATDLARARVPPQGGGPDVRDAAAGHHRQSALVFGHMLADFSPGRLVQVIQASAVATLVLNGLALWKQESRAGPTASPRAPPSRLQPGLGGLLIAQGDGTRCVGWWPSALGTLAFGMQDVLLEPYGGQVLGMSGGRRPPG